MEPLEQKLRDSNISTTNLQLAELQRKVLEMAKYVHNWVSNPLEGIIANANLFLHHQDRNELGDHSYELLRKSESFYANIPSSALHGKVEGYLLFTAIDHLFELKETMDKLFEEKSDNGLNELATQITAIGMTEKEYFRKLLGLLRQIRYYPEAKDFMVEIIDDKGGAWHI